MELPELERISQEHPVLFFDGVCVFCNGFIHFLIKRDSRQVFRYATLQGVAGRIISSHLGMNKEIETVIALYQGKTYTHSDVTFLIIKHLGGFWKTLLIFRLVPKVIRDKLYSWFANNRYKWFGKRDYCELPAKEWRSLFIEEPGKPHTG